jgi:hypothetical protein
MEFLPEAGQAHAQSHATEADLIRDLGRAVAFKAEMENVLFGWIEGGEQFLELVVKLSPLGGVVARLAETGEDVRGVLGGPALAAESLLALEVSPVAGCLAAKHRQSKADQLFGFIELEFRRAQPAKEAFMHRLSQVSRFQVRLQRGPEQHAGDNPELVFVGRNEFRFRGAIAIGNPSEQSGEVGPMLVHRSGHSDRV